MSRIHEIPVVVVNEPATEPLSGRPNVLSALAILNEIDAKLEDLAANGQESTIDLRWLMGSQSQLDLLRSALGEGEVAATVTNFGSSLLQESAIPCVWWVTHRDRDDRPIGEFVEITEIPELLRSDRLSIGRGRDELRARCAALENSDPTLSMPSSSGSLS